MNIPNIPNAFENIKEACIKKINELYPHKIPVIVQERFAQELLYVKSSKYLDDFEIYRNLSNEAYKCGLYFTFRGAIAGSYLVYLMGLGRQNPLPAHYYCPNCGHFETVSTHLYGIDLPEKSCPKCGTSIQGDGFNLPIESVWGIDGKKTISFDYNIYTEFLPFAKKILSRLYPQTNIVLRGTKLLGDVVCEAKSFEIVPGGFVILPSNQSIDDYPDLKTYLQNGEPCLAAFTYMLEKYPIKSIILIPNQHMDNLVTLQRKTGFYITDISTQNLCEITYYDIMNSRVLSSNEDLCFSYRRPKFFMEMSSYLSLSHSTFDSAKHKSSNQYSEAAQYILDTPEFQKYPCTSREDFFDYLLEIGCIREEAFKISEIIRKGRASFDPAFDTLDLPADFIVLAKKYRYLFPRAHSTECLLTYARLAYYMKLDSRAYGSVVF